MSIDILEDVSRETRERLEIYAGLVRKWSPQINLVAKSTLPNVMERHIADSAQIAQLIEGTPKRLCDLGSGAGFPGMVLAVLLSGRGTDVHLVESDQRKAAFLRTVARETGVPVTVHAKRIEMVQPLQADILTARALTSLDMLLDFTTRHLAPGGIAVFPKGRKAQVEVEQALERWRFDCETVPSQTDPEAVILKIKDVERV